MGGESDKLVVALGPLAPADWITRGRDVLLASVLLFLLAPLFCLVAGAIRLESRGPVFFVQTRRGRRMRPFRMLKFRSMTHGATDPHERYETVQSDPRITRVGALIRRTSIDELPQLFNVLGGTMSLVGPRPLVEWESRAAFETHPERFEVSPGLTGWSQVTVRNSVGFDARLDKDVEYVRRRSNWLDLVILLRTPLAVLRNDGIYPDD